MRAYGKTTVSEFLGDFIVYRKLVPMDRRLPTLEAVRDRLELPSGRIPRKSEPDYARVIVHLLREARRVDAPGTTIQRLLFVGDTRLNDSTAFANICRAGNWPGLAFIGNETTGPQHIEIQQMDAPSPAHPEGERPTLFLANRWAALREFDRFATDRGFATDAGTAIVIDLDKTTLGARGRNDPVIDQARVLAVRHTVADLLGDSFDPHAFRTAYDLLNQQKFHPFTADNQDYLAYICLILGAGLYELDAVVAAVESGRLSSFGQFITEVDKTATLPAGLRRIHQEVYANVRNGDPTPFKAFRYNEYRTTVALMGHMSDDTPVQDLLSQEIVITQEVRTQALTWRSQGALLFGLSDKPDEASVPSQGLADEGYRPIHQTATHAMGE